MKFNKQQWQWVFYDWANSGYGILVVTAVLPVYFKAVAHQNGISAALSTALWGYANSAGTLDPAVYPHEPCRKPCRQ